MSPAHVGPDRGSPPSTPRWVKVFGIVALGVVVLFVILHLADPARYGPGHHTPPKHGVQQP